ncbi:MAG TPA: bifunctional [glutamine synthetase] adenylyltransferase/[glutamine synthetase]-adenylyl-L-tyrosine phosphorylase [Candidatus Sulfotelmatobacter sp.]|nr:bifunctional [glutamine synthetase] adenylyltransferase/[glutamine synthetase]-adenylyl-L-tyrosine phosphorylase [Candidatus Sulfotelmatobacter sp.]
MSFQWNSQALPRPFDSAMAERHRERWLEEATEQDDQDIADFMRKAVEDRDILALTDSLFGNSPFLSHCLIREPAFFRRLLTLGADETFRLLLAEIPREDDTNALMRSLRIAKRRAALLIGLADITGAWPLEKITGALTDLADRSLSLASAHLLRKAHEAGDIVLPCPGEPERESGLLILGMGKHGGRELNYSSDIDIIVFYDEEKLTYQGRKTLGEMFIRMARDLVRIMEERTVDGYVFRTDLRLRPDPGSMPAAISMTAAEMYYEGFGQNWERAAMIKARQVAGDPVTGEQFAKMIRPFIWRKNLDFAAIQDIHSIKRQINAHKGGGRIAVAGHNIKLGRGGIREIEFFAQTQQLIWGGREPPMRVPRTCEALTALAAAGHTQEQAVAELIEAYRFLRQLEHRLQMTDDKQTQTLPEGPERLTALAVFMGFAGIEDFSQALTKRLRIVETHYAALFEDAAPLNAPCNVGGNLVFTGSENDPETLQTITAMGFTNAEGICAAIRGWHHGRVRATRSTRARELLTELTPALLSALAATAEPETAFHRFETFLAQLPAGVPLFSLFHANPTLLELVAEIMGDAPRLAENLARNTNLLDGVLSAGFFDAPPPAPQLSEELNLVLAESGGDFQDMLDRARRWTNEQKFRIGVQTLRSMIEPSQACHHLSDIADAVLLSMQPKVEAEFARAHGLVPGGGCAIIAMGKMGSREMTAASDLDLILVYHSPEDVEQSDGAKPLAPSTYYARLTQRIINSITAKTAEGELYEVDMRLRPSGNSGPIATSLASFIQYQDSLAWTWEHMALTRARVVTGPNALRATIRDVIAKTLRRPRDPDKLLADVADMRERMAREHKSDNPWEVKHRRGGLVDIEFIAQYLQLRWGDAHPSLLKGSTAPVLEEAARLDLLPEADCELLLDALRLWQAIQQVLRQTIEGSFFEEHAPGRLKDVLVRAANATHFEGLRQLMTDRASAVHALFNRLIDDPAQPILAKLAAEKES